MFKAIRQLRPLVKTQIQSQLTTTLGLFLTQGCSVCDRPSFSPFCTDCHRQIQDLCSPPRSWETVPEQPFAINALGPYAGPLKQAILALKYHNRPDVARVLGAALGKQWLAQSSQLSTLLAPQILSNNQSLQQTLCVVPIPLHSSRQAQRGYNQAALIAKAFCQVTGLPIWANGLRRVQNTQPQHQLGLRLRQENLSQAFQLGSQQWPLPAQPNVLLIDDIYTTGTTVNSAANVLTSAQIKTVGVLTLARAISD
ncbi:MAG: ComF family protein [Cyanobacteria bacterium J06606_4]